MPVFYACECGAELRLRFDNVRQSDSRRVRGYAYNIDDVFSYLDRGDRTSHDIVDLNGEVLSQGDCQAEYERSGDCNLCGECCRYVFQSISDEECADPDHRRWLDLRGGRVDRTRHGAWDVLQHPCQALKVEGDGRQVCGCYEERPELCKRWPEHPWDIEPYPQCGFTFRRVSIDSGEGGE
ncbi:MAG: YkgJ family cysteine cluster protein [Chloroflexi bacterium]|nr:YkgJ family cysteine cluster protein [Chloroflexota bacterium]